MLKDNIKKIGIQIVFILIITAIILINTRIACLAKYVFNYTITVAEIFIEST